VRHVVEDQFYETAQFVGDDPRGSFPVAKAGQDVTQQLALLPVLVDQMLRTLDPRRAACAQRWGQVAIFEGQMLSKLPMERESTVAKRGEFVLPALQDPERLLVELIQHLPEKRVIRENVAADFTRRHRIALLRFGGALRAIDSFCFYLLIGMLVHHLKHSGHGFRLGRFHHRAPERLPEFARTRAAASRWGAQASAAQQRVSARPELPPADAVGGGREAATSLVDPR
jgi:hypothetical protein